MDGYSGEMIDQIFENGCNLLVEVELLSIPLSERVRGKFGSEKRGEM